MKGKRTTSTNTQVSSCSSSLLPPLLATYRLSLWASRYPQTPPQRPGSRRRGTVNGHPAGVNTHAPIHGKAQDTIPAHLRARAKHKDTHACAHYRIAQPRHARAPWPIARADSFQPKGDSLRRPSRSAARPPWLPDWVLQGGQATNPAGASGLLLIRPCVASGVDSGTLYMDTVGQ